VEKHWPHRRKRLRMWAVIIKGAGHMLPITHPDLLGTPCARTAGAQLKR